MGMGTTTNGGEIGHFGEAAHFYENFECLEVLGEGLSSVVRRSVFFIVPKFNDNTYTQYGF